MSTHAARIVFYCGPYTFGDVGEYANSQPQRRRKRFRAPIAMGGRRDGRHYLVRSPVNLSTGRCSTVYRVLHPAFAARHRTATSSAAGPVPLQSAKKTAASAAANARLARLVLQSTPLRLTGRKRRRCPKPRARSRGLVRREGVSAWITPSKLSAVSSVIQPRIGPVTIGRA